MHLLGHVKGVMECWEKVVVDLAGNGHKQICGSPCRYDCKICVLFEPIAYIRWLPSKHLPYLVHCGCSCAVLLAGLVEICHRSHDYYLWCKLMPQFTKVVYLTSWMELGVARSASQ